MIDCRGAMPLDTVLPLEIPIGDTFSKPARNDFSKMPPLTGLEFLLERLFYKYVAPTALRFTSKLIPCIIGSLKVKKRGSISMDPRID
jgi:hypothetical protein